VPIDLKLFDTRQEVDKEIRSILKKIRGKIGWYDDLPDGIKE
jgi:hypothetical protein